MLKLRLGFFNPIQIYRTKSIEILKECGEEDWVKKYEMGLLGRKYAVSHNH
jgi:hypothetical protein